MRISWIFYLYQPEISVLRKTVLAQTLSASSFTSWSARGLIWICAGAIGQFYSVCLAKEPFTAGRGDGLPEPDFSDHAFGLRGALGGCSAWDGSRADQLYGFLTTPRENVGHHNWSGGKRPRTSKWK